MIALLQRVKGARVEVDEQVVGEINQGLLVFVGFDQQDDEAGASKTLNRLLNFRVFADQNDKMNLSLLDVGGELLIVPQFTLVADTKKGRRPSFAQAAHPDKGQLLYNYFVEQAERNSLNIQTGSFAADMQVFIQNDGPATFILK
ncbi:MAG: D-tyrosyl-tRNA(Tyr) deacylase [Gammaproteobacteria bacterium]|nr:D-tyrosyl-tRNA(Tyr) deacylase [Gammaproteobacteria bacterium]